MVGKSKPYVTWDKAAYQSLQKAFDDISEDSLLNGTKVRDAILKIIGHCPIT
jgi:hypothetical protein